MPRLYKAVDVVLPSRGEGGAGRTSRRWRWGCQDRHQLVGTAFSVVGYPLPYELVPVPAERNPRPPLGRPTSALRRLMRRLVDRPDEAKAKRRAREGAWPAPGNDARRGGERGCARVAEVLATRKEERKEAVDRGRNSTVSTVRVLGTARSRARCGGQLLPAAMSASSRLPPQQRPRGGADLEFSRVSPSASRWEHRMAAYCGGAIDAQAELGVEMVLLSRSRRWPRYFGKWVRPAAPPPRDARGVCRGACPTFAICVRVRRDADDPLRSSSSGTVVLRRKERSFFKRIPAKTARKLLHSAFWPSWLIVVSFRAPFLLRAAADTLPSAAGWLYLGFAALVLYMDLLWTLESAISKSHGVVGPAISEPGGWPKGLNTVQPWAVWPVFVGLAAAIVLWRPP